MRKRKTSPKKPVGRRPQDIDPDARETEDVLTNVDLNSLESATLEIDPVLLEQARSKAKLKQITIRIGEEQLEIARRVASTRGEKYQQVLRRWLAYGASEAKRDLTKTGS
ncbi:hypothetical protein ACFL6C_09980 [Myxococcota bacterium]